MKFEYTIKSTIQKTADIHLMALASSLSDPMCS